MALKNFATSVVATAPSPATSGTSLVVGAGHGARLPSTPFYASLHPEGTMATWDTAEIVEVTGKASDTLTIVRAQRSSTAKAVDIGWRISSPFYAEDVATLTDTQTLTNKTLTAPTIADFTNMAHDHQDNDDGGVLTGAALTSTDGLLRNMLTYTSNDTWTKPAGLKFVIVQVVGGGGGGGGADATSANVAVGSGGGSGGYGIKKIAVGSLGSTETVTIGAGGTGVSGSIGNTGGTSSFGAHVSCTGGVGGTVLVASGTIQFQTGGGGGASSSANINVDGNNGNMSMRISASRGAGGGGGSSPYGRGGADTNGTGTSQNVTGFAAQGNGAGGGGGSNTGTQSAVLGGAGTAGIIIVHEYF